MALSDWLDIADQLTALRPLPQITLWGGEPLVCPFFGELSEALYRMGFELSLVTNGTLLDKHIDTVSRCFHKVYVSVDGLEALHDSIRGKGVFRKTDGGLRRIPKDKIVIMTVATEALDIAAFAEYYKDYTILLHTKIAFSPEEIKAYKAWLEDVFRQKAAEIDAWGGERFVPDTTRLPENVLFVPHGVTVAPCKMPNRHLHIMWNGETNFCTDYYDFSLGNVRQNSVEELFCSEKAELFRKETKQGNCISCNHCAWRNNIRI